MEVNILNVPIDGVTLKEYLRRLLYTLWTEGEGFSGKRPFGNGGWQFDVYKALVENSYIKGEIDEDGYLIDCDEDAGKKLVIWAINQIFFQWTQHEIHPH